MLKEKLQNYIDQLKKQSADILEVLENKKDSNDKLKFTIDEHLFLASKNLDFIVMNLEHILKEEEK